jgi:mRNA interferase HigB
MRTLCFHYNSQMRIYSLSTLKKYWLKHPRVENNLKHWHKKILSKEYHSLRDIIADFSKADAVGNDRIVFNIKGNDYRLIARFNFDYQLCYVKFIDTHAEYDKVDAKTVGL